MNSIEKNLMIGMISILQDVIESKRCGELIVSDEYIDNRLADLKDFENETGVMFVNSPNCKINLESIINITEINKDNLKECKDASEIVEYSNQKEMIVYLDIIGDDMIVTYTDGYLTNIQSNYSDSKNIIKRFNLPYKIKKDGIYTVKGKIANANQSVFYVSDILEGGSDNLKNDLNEAEVLNFNIVPFWLANNLNPEKLINTINYVIDDMTEDNLKCDGVIFKPNEKKLGSTLDFVGCYWSKLQ